MDDLVSATSSIAKWTSLTGAHDWTTWDKYLRIHDAYMAEHPFVLASRLDDWDLVGDPIESIRLTGDIICYSGIIIRVSKTLEVRSGRKRQLEVRGAIYAYNAYYPGRYNILRYDNGHFDTPEEFHRHEFDLDTGAEVSVNIIRREDMPTLAEFMTEVSKLVGFKPD